MRDWSVKNWINVIGKSIRSSHISKSLSQTPQKNRSLCRRIYRGLDESNRQRAGVLAQKASSRLVASDGLMQMSISDAWNSVHELEQENGRGHSLVPSSLPRCIGYQDVYVDERTWLPSRPRRRRRDVDSGRESANRWKKKRKKKKKKEHAESVSHKYRKGRETKRSRTRKED